jgi:pyruvate formate lyase activating enzyme
MTSALVNNIIPFSNVDGPGCRSAIFLQGCTLKCLFCHNPETINKCINCGKCVKSCPQHALTIKNGKVLWNKDLCVSCDTCIHVCAHLASPRVREMSPQDIINEIKPYIPYIRGITVSGGECTMWKDFLKELFILAKKENLTCLIDSNGTLDFSLNKDLLDLSDGVMLDVKAYDQKFHEYLCKGKNDIILKNLKYLKSVNKLYEVRTVLLNNNRDANLDTIKNVSKIIGDSIRYKLIKYRPYGVRDEGKKELGNTEFDNLEALKLIEYAKECGALKATLI